MGKKVRQADIDTFLTAAQRRDHETLVHCLSKGVDPNVLNKFNKTALHMAAENGDSKTINILCQWKHVNIEVRVKDFMFTPLHLACRHEQYEAVRLLLQFGAEVNSSSRNEVTALHFAVYASNMSIIKLLLTFGADPNQIDAFSATPLSLAVLDTRCYLIVRQLLKNGADPNLPRPRSMPLFYEAVLNVSPHMPVAFLEILHKYGADCNVVDTSGRNAMHYCAISGNGQVALFLVSIGCLIDIVDYTGRTPADIAKDQNNHTVFELLTKLSTLDS